MDILLLFFILIGVFLAGFANRIKKLEERIKKLEDKNGENTNQ